MLRASTNFDFAPFSAASPRQSHLASRLNLLASKQASFRTKILDDWRGQPVGRPLAYSKSLHEFFSLFP
jgi:hypothetical protein